MTRTGQLLLVSLCVCLAGCAALPGLSTETPGSPTATGTGAAGTAGAGQTTAATTGTGAAPPATGTGTRTGTATSTPRPENVTVEYVLRAGSVPAAFQSLTVELEVVFAERSSDLDECIGTLLGSRYEPTPTPPPTPVGDCRTESGLRADLAALNGTQTLGPFTVPGRFDGAYALVVRDVAPVYANGTAPTAIHDTDFRAHVQPGRGPGRYGVEIGVAIAASDRPWTYAVVRRNFDPASNPGDVTGTDTGANGSTGTAAGTGTSTGRGTGTNAGTGTDAETGTDAGAGTAASPGASTRTGTAS